MKIAVFSDIHSNYTALKAVAAHIEAWRPDQVVVAGDLVNRGPKPRQCLSFVQAKEHSEGWLTIRGNHEDYVIHRAQPDAPRSGPAFEVHRASHWTLQQLGDNISPLLAMPPEVSLSGPDGSEVRIVHGSMLGKRDGIHPETSERDLAAKIGAPPDLFCVGHTHRPLVRTYQGTLVVNAGSAGLPFDGDTRPSYAQITWQGGEWQARIVRVAYNLEAAVKDFYTTGYLHEAGPLAELVLIELRTARSQLYDWSNKYQARALKGQISMRESVRQFLGD